MLPFQRILFPIDYSEPCRAVIPYVQEMAYRFSTELTVAHAYIPLAAVINSELLVSDPELQAKAHVLEEEKLKQFACRAFPGQKFECIAQLGEPGGVIQHLVQERRADLVMLATHGHGPMRRFLLGSVTAKVLHDVSAAVWTGVGHALADHPVSVPYQSIVCAVDESNEAPAVLKAASAIAKIYGAQLWILHVVPTPPAYPDVSVAGHLDDLMEAAHFKLRDLKSKLGVDAPHTVVNDVLAEGVRQEVIRRKGDLLVTGRGHAIGTFSRLWSHLYAIIRDSPCPVLSV
jgi:nucleotide-binding universal stress UspA family protein